MNTGLTTRYRWAFAAVLLITVGLLTGSALLQPVPKKPNPEAANDETWASPDYLQWLEKQSLLEQSRRLSTIVSGRGMQWQRQYAEPQPEAIVQKASVWVLGYPGSVITRPGESVIATWADQELWKAFDEIGIRLLHTGPVKRSGGIVGKKFTPTIDGWFDRISLDIDPELGTEDEYRAMVKAASDHKALIAGDLVPLHTGKGADFLLALRAYRDYPGMYTLVEIDQKDWGLLPEVKSPWASELLSDEVAEQLMKRGYIPGRIDSCDADPKVRKSSGWSATGTVVGEGGKSRRWVYLHYFKPGQPTLNWLDPTNAAQRALAGDIVRTIPDLGARVVRLDAVPFLGIERQPGTLQTQHYQHPLSILGTNQLAFLTRKLGGWSFQELNVPLKQLKAFMKEGPDLTYNFVTRAEGLHALLMGDADLLREAYRYLLQNEVPLLRLVHDLQNHDELTFQLVPLGDRGDENFQFRGKTVKGKAVREQVLMEMRTKASGQAAPYNLLYRPEKDGLATTFPGFIAAALKVQDLDNLTDEHKALIQRGHLLLTWANAMQPGVFSLSSWDLVGALPLDRKLVEDRMNDGDVRWVNRGGVDLMGVNPRAKASSYGLPRARTLYGSLPEQLKNQNSYVSQLKRLLAARKKYRIAEGELVAVLPVKNTALCVLVMRLPGKPQLAVTALNFGREPLREALDLSQVPGVLATELAGRPAIDVLTEKATGQIDPAGKLQIEPDGWVGKTVLLELAK